MIEIYPQLKSLHVAAVISSFSLFVARGILVQAGNRLAMRPTVRYLSYSIDTILLGAAVALVVILPSAVFNNGWLIAKLVLLVVYIGLGTFALKRGRTANMRASCFVAAIVVFALMFIIARTHDPLGPLHLVFAAL